MSETAYPNREHMQADKAATRRALKALDQIIDIAETLRRRINEGRPVDGAGAYQLISEAVSLTVNLSTLETLRDVREWHEADMKEAGQ